MKLEDQKEYRVTWYIDIYAASPEDAARRALEIQRDPESIATIFDVALDGEPAETVDLYHD